MTDLLLKNDATVDVEAKFHYTQIHWAAIQGNHEIVKLLLNKNPDTDVLGSFGRKPVDCAVEKEHYEVVKLIDGSASKLLSAENILKFFRHYESVLEQMAQSFSERCQHGEFLFSDGIFETRERHRRNRLCRVHSCVKSCR
jgi:hypothetical protein